MIPPGMDKPFSFFTRLVIRIWPGMHLFPPTYNKARSPVRKHYLAWSNGRYNELCAEWAQNHNQVARIKKTILNTHYKIMCRFWLA